MSFTAKQDLLIRAQLTIVSRLGPWAKDFGPDGAAYSSSPLLPANAPPGLRCGNCAFWQPGAATGVDANWGRSRVSPTGGSCQIVSGSIERTGLCRFNVVMGDRLKIALSGGVASGVTATSSLGSGLTPKRVRTP